MKILNLPRLLDDQGITYGTNRDWIQLQCPHCDDRKQHLGFNLKSGVFSCFRCGKHRTWETVAKLLGINLLSAKTTCRNYEKGSSSFPTKTITTQNNNNNNTLKLPYGTALMTSKHKNYLKSRQFDPDWLEKEWDLFGTGPVGEFKHRIIIPIYDEDRRLVCFQGRDITNKANTKYKSCHDQDAVIPIKSCLYGIDRIPDRDWVIITEGVTKVWRLQKRTICTFGTVVTNNQLLKLAEFKKRYILFDRDEAGTDGAEKLAESLKMFSGTTEIISLSSINDVAELPQLTANTLLNQLAFWSKK